MTVVKMEVARTASGDEDITDVMRKGPFTYDVRSRFVRWRGGVASLGY